MQPARQVSTNPRLPLILPAKTGEGDRRRRWRGRKNRGKSTPTHASDRSQIPDEPLPAIGKALLLCNPSRSREEHSMGRRIAPPRSSSAFVTVDFDKAGKQVGFFM